MSLLNGNSFLIGVSGSGKSFTAKREIASIALSTEDDIIVIDPEREYHSLINGLGGEVIHISATSASHINAMDMEAGYGDGEKMCIRDSYNPFVYLRDDKDVLKLVTNLIQATTPKGSHESDPFWTKAETALFMAIILMLFHEAPAYEQNFSMVLKVLEYAEVKEEDEEHVSPLDLLFNSLEQEQPDHIAVKQYHIFKMAAGRTAKSILVAAAVRINAFSLPQIQACLLYTSRCV